MTEYTRRNLLSVVPHGAVAMALAPVSGAAQPIPSSISPGSQSFLDKAEQLKPRLNEFVQTPLGLVSPVKDTTQALGWRIERTGDAEAIASGLPGKKGDVFIIDFGGHRAGHLSFDIENIGEAIGAPVRIRFTFGEVIPDIAEPLHPFKGWLSESWLPEEIVTIDLVPSSVRLPRRYAFRFVKIELLGLPIGRRITLRNVCAHAVTSATGTVPALPKRFAADLLEMDRVAAATLRDCMQTVFEDGPRRDQRLWTGDLRLQALTSYVTYPKNDLVKRCLYLLAAFPREDGLLPANVFEYPRPMQAPEFMMDYSALFSVTLADYVAATNDTTFGLELWEIALKQVQLVGEMIGDDGSIRLPKGILTFVDWNPQLDRNASLYAIYIYALKRVIALGEKLGRVEDISGFHDKIARAEAAAIKAFWSPELKLFTSGSKRQISMASQAWMTLAGVGTRKMQSAGLLNALRHPDVFQSRTPYLTHYVTEALFVAGHNSEALKMMRAYWGGMLKAGADTFWEAYSPDNPRVAPYNDFHVNSFCHAWSCTPSYLLRRYEHQIG
jgi:hypothetical protein